MIHSSPRKAWRAAALLLLACAGLGAQAALADEICGRFAKPPEQPNSAEVGAVLDEFLKIPDAPTVITSIEPVKAAGSLPAYCRFKGTTAPQINFELRLPVEWNGKFLMQGCGGMCGWLNMGATEDSLEKRYAVVNTDMGHSDPPAVAIWAYDNRSAELDFAYRSTWTTAVVSKRIAEAFYGSAPKRSYFNGCSTGGRQGMLAAQRFPELFDGIISGAPVLNQTGTGMLHLLWSARANVSADGKPILSTAKLKRVHGAVVAACDRMDGVADGVIPDPRACSFQPEALACARNGAQDGAAGEACLNPAELAALRKLYDGASNSTGRLAFAGGGGLPRGSEYTWSPVFVNEAGRHGLIISSPSLIQQLIQYKVFYQDPGATMTLMDFDFERDVPRLALTEAFYNAQNPDLRRFKARGGKLLAYHGWDDTEVTPGYSVDYYEMATRAMGGPEATRDFYRLFMVPGMGHCRRGNGADAIDYLDALERWVEHGEAPEKLVAHKLVKEQSYLGLPRPRYPLKPEEYRWRRPVYAYPDVAVFTGRGDSADPANWKPRRLPPAEAAPAPASARTR
jgi:feruloyl esterase